MAALLVADELSATKKDLGKLTEEGDPAGEAMLAESLEELANRVEAIAVRIEAA
jgi:cell division protein ZapA (FtsZ GTPase activity inhibitor)